MKRKVIQLAGKTHVISLPSKWVHQHAIKKGDELDILEKDQHLLVTTTSAVQHRKINIDLTNLQEYTIRHTLSALHKSGYDAIEIIYDTPKTINIIHDMLKNVFIGFAMLEQTSKRCVLKSISQDQREEFEPTLRRAFLVTLSLADATLETIKKTNYSPLQDLLILENANNQLTNFCERIINKYAYDEKNTFLYVITWNLEKIADDYKTLCLALVTHSKPIQPALLTLHQKVNELLRSYYTLLYTYTPTSFEHAIQQSETIKTQLMTIMPKNNHEQRMLNILSSLTTKTLDFSASIIALHHQRTLQH